MVEDFIDDDRVFEIKTVGRSKRRDMSGRLPAIVPLCTASTRAVCLIFCTIGNRIPWAGKEDLIPIEQD